MRDDFGIFILSHGRPEGVSITIGSLERGNYTGKWWIVLDTDDDTAPDYAARWGRDRILTFSKDEIGRTFDIGDNLPGPRGVGVFARNAIAVLAADLGLTYYMQLDDDYDQLSHRFVRGNTLTFAYTYHLDLILEAFVDWLEDTGALTVAMAQGGDFIGGIHGSFKRPVLRKAMNTFIARVDRPLQFVGRFNDDVTTYVVKGGRGDLFLTATDFNIHQKPTAAQAGGMTEVYRDGGTYLKSFYSVMYAPSCVKIGTIGETTIRVHHSIRWGNAVPKIVPGRCRKDPTTGPAAPAVGDSTTPALSGPQIGGTPAAPRMIGRTRGEYLDLFRRCLTEAGIPDAAQVAADTARAVHFAETGKGDDMLAPVRDRWYASLDAGAPDFGVYDDFLVAAFDCWWQYPRRYLNDAAKPGSVFSRLGVTGTVYDVGCGIGFTTSALAELLPDCEVVGTELVSPTRRVGETLATLPGFAPFKIVDAATSPGDLLFASEYFEHFEAPVDHLRELLTVIQPRHIIVASTFTKPAIGHFPAYRTDAGRTTGAATSREFNKALRAAGYRRIETGLWNNRPAYWTKDPTYA